MPRTVDLEPLVSRVLAPNPSPMTLDGTNTYVVGEPGSGQAVLVDPGPDDAAHLGAVEDALAARDARCVAVLVTHHHGDHAEAALPWGARFDARGAPARPHARRPPAPTPPAPPAACSNRGSGWRSPAPRSRSSRRRGTPATTWPSGWSPAPSWSATTSSGAAPRWSPTPRGTSSPTWSRCAACTTWARAPSTAATAPS